MNELMVSRARWSLLPLLRPPDPQDGEPSSTPPANASPELSSLRHVLASPSTAAPGASGSGGFRTRMRHMRDKIRRRVVQTGDWPPPGAIFGDRYSVSSGIGAMLAAGRQIPSGGATAGGHWSAPPSRKTYPAQKKNVESFPLKKPSGTSGSDAQNVKTKSCAKKGGIVCSEMDMNAIIAGFREFEKSIRILHHTSGTLEPCADAANDEKLQSEPAVVSAPSIVIDGVEADGDEELKAAAKVKVRAASASPAVPLKRSQAGKKQVSFDDQTFGERCQSDACVRQEDETGSPERESPQPVIPSDHSALMDIVNAACAKDEEEETTVKRKQSPKEVEFDEFGQTWDVYGADFDPEILGYAIQRRLDHMMEKELREVMEQQQEQTADDSQKCERLRRMWRNLWCATRRQSQQDATTSPSNL